MYTRMFDLPNMNDGCKVWLYAGLNACLGHELTSDGLPWLDFCQVENPIDPNYLRRPQMQMSGG